MIKHEYVSTHQREKRFFPESGNASNLISCCRIRFRMMLSLLLFLCVGSSFCSDAVENKEELIAKKDYNIDNSWKPLLIYDQDFFYALRPDCWRNPLTSLKLQDSAIMKKSGITLLSPCWVFPAPTRNPQELKGFIPNLKDICLREVKIFDGKDKNIAKEAVIYGESDGGGFKNLDVLTDNNLEKACSSNYPMIDKAQTGFISFSFNEIQKLKKIEIYHGRKNGCAFVSIPKQYQLQYNNGNGWANIPGTEVKNNAKDMTIHEFPEISASAIKICVKDQSDLYDYRGFPFSIDNRFMKRNIIAHEKLLPPGTPFQWWYLGHTGDLFFGFPKNPNVDMEGYGRWKSKHPLFFGFPLLEWDNDVLMAFLPMGKAFKKEGFVPEIDGRPLTRAYINACKTRIVERDFPQGYPKDRDELVKLMEDEFKYQNKVLFNDAFMMLSHTTWYHYSLEWGAKLFTLESTGGTPNRQLQYAFARGISREYQKPWGVYFAYFLGAGYLDYINPPKKMDQNYSRGPHCGISASSHRRQLYFAYLSGAAFFDFEQQDIVPFIKSEDGKYRFSPHGLAMKEVFDFSQKHPERGTVYAPVGLMLDYAHGWTFWGDTQKVFMGMFSPTDGDLMTDRILYTIFPWDKNRFEEGRGYCMTNTPYGDIFDVIIPNPPSGSISSEKLKNYKVLILLGDIKIDQSLAARLIEYVANGGTLILNAEQLDEKFNSDFSGVECSDFLETGSLAKSTEDGSIISNGATKFKFRKAKLFSARPLVVNEKDAPLVTVNKYKKGNVILTMQRYLLSDTQEKQALPTVGYLLNRIAKGAILPVSVTGNIEYILNKNQNGWWLSLINNKGIYKKGTEPEVIKQDEAAKVTVKFAGKAECITELISEQKIKFSEKEDGIVFDLCIPSGEINILEIKTSENKISH